MLNNYPIQDQGADSFERTMARQLAAQAFAWMINSRVIVPPKRQDETVVWYKAAPKRAIIAVEPTAVRNYTVFTRPRTETYLRDVFQNRRVRVTVNGGFFLQVAYLPDDPTTLKAAPLDLACQPSPLHVPIGTTERGPLWLALDEMQATLIGGASGTGKTNFLQCAIQSLIHGRVAQLVLYDGKAGMKYARYSGVPRVRVINGELLPVLGSLGLEMQRRFETILAAGANDFNDYNVRQQPGARMLPIALVIDELATALLEEGLQDELIKLLNRGREAGIYLLLATQHTSAKTVPTAIKVNCVTRIAFAVPAMENSRVILDRSGAERLPTNPPGRLLIVRGARLVQAHAFIAQDFQPTTRALVVSPDLSDDDMGLLRTAQEKAQGWFRSEQIGYLVGRNKNAISGVAQRLERQGYLTSVQTELGTGKRLGRKVTDKALGLLAKSEPIPDQILQGAPIPA